VVKVVIILLSDGSVLDHCKALSRRSMVAAHLVLGCSKAVLEEVLPRRETLSLFVKRG
jgi:hypothetical protein